MYKKFLEQCWHKVGLSMTAVIADLSGACHVQDKASLSLHCLLSRSNGLVNGLRVPGPWSIDLSWLNCFGTASCCSRHFALVLLIYSFLQTLFWSRPILVWSTRWSHFPVSDFCSHPALKRTQNAQPAPMLVICFSSSMESLYGLSLPLHNSENATLQRHPTKFTYLI